MTDDIKNKETPKKNKDFKEIEIEHKDLLDVFFDKSGSQFESQFFLSRKRMLNAENGQNELSELLKSKLKALDMMLSILSNNKNILKESDLSCCEVLNNLLSISKKDKSYGEHIYFKIKSIILYILKNQLSLKEKNIESKKGIIMFLLTLLNIKFDNGYFKQVLEIISLNQEMFTLFINELFDKLFKGRNIIIKIKEMKYMLKTILLEKKIKKYMTYFDLIEKILSYAQEKGSGGCRTSFQLNQVIYLLQYLLDILSMKEIKNSLPQKEELNKRLLKILNDLNISLNKLVNKNDYEFDVNKISKKDLASKNETIKRKKIFFGEAFNFLNKLENNFEKELDEKEFNKVIEDINNLYKNIINVKYIVIMNINNKDDKDKTNKKEKKIDNKKEDNENKEKNKGKKIKDKKEKENNKEGDNNDNNEEREENEGQDNDEENDDGNDYSERRNKNKGIELDEDMEEEDENEKRKNKKINKNKEKNIEKLENNKNKEKENENKNNKGSKKENKNKKKKEH